MDLWKRTARKQRNGWVRGGEKGGFHFFFVSGIQTIRSDRLRQEDEAGNGPTWGRGQGLERPSPWKMSSQTASPREIEDIGSSMDEAIRTIELVD